MTGKCSKLCVTQNMRARSGQFALGRTQRMRRLNEHPDITNRLLLALPPPEMERIRPALEPVDLLRGQGIGRLGQQVRYMYFVNRGLISLMKTMRDGRTVEVGAIGVEGVTDAIALFEINTTLVEGAVTIPGWALRIRTDALRVAMQESPALHELMQRYVAFSFRQLTQTAACNRLHPLNRRCCCWLLNAHESALSDALPVTHELLAMVLGTRRAGVTIAMNTLASAGLIRQIHGSITVVDRRGLCRAACECYAATRDGLDTLFSVGSRRGRSR